MRSNLQRLTDHEGRLLAGNVAMVSYRYDRFADDVNASPQAAHPLTRGYSRYCDQPMDWRTRIVGVVGTAAVAAMVLACVLFTWRIVRPAVVSPSAPLVVELQPLAAPPGPAREVAPGPEQVERREVRPKPEPDIVPPPLVQLPLLTPMAREVREPVGEVIDPGPPVPETTAPKTVAAPAADRLSSDASQSWEARLLAHLEQYRRFPARARAARQQGTVQIRFRMNRAGSILTASVQRSSGFATLDQAALDTLKRAQPLPAIPKGRPDEIELTIPVEFYLSAQR
ncbi:protein TonB [Novosphingobium sp. CF614]|uniref:energy transducer TonB n=1 Tax=Novosphingobium sp. CF614 TaxID=1884364 RepID=UPI0008EEFBDA|nr:energy transducer TonB [Novosphingobium sp. CF614]SFG34199.1 protein TonB [Novosphingobium sp. CF614]